MIIATYNLEELWMVVGEQIARLQEAHDAEQLEVMCDIHQRIGSLLMQIEVMREKGDDAGRW